MGIGPKSDHGNLLSWMWYLEHTSNLSTQDAEAGGSVSASLVYIASQAKVSCCGLLCDVGSVIWS